MTRSDAIVRRQLLKAGLIVAGLPFCPEALFDRRAAADDERPAEDTPIGPREIIKGLDGMSRVADIGDTFGDGHNAAAVISSVFFWTLLAHPDSLRGLERLGLAARSR